jgi:LAO/AO transport system kinase
MSQDKDKSKKDSALHVNPGIDQPEAVNPNLKRIMETRRRRQLSADDYVEGILNDNRTLLGQAITLIESNLPKHNELAQEIIARCLPHAGNSVRIGITGVPGVGKSTFIEALGSQLTDNGKKLAVLAVDPSSERTKGSILGDKTRMETLSGNPLAFIRPSPSAGSLGGVARKTRETIVLCEAAGYDTIFIETVGVGQSEVAVHSMVDMFLLLMLAGAGDELQGIKRGIMEMADLIAITKADGTNKEKAEGARVQYQNALHLFPASESNWTPQVTTCSSLTDTGIGEVWHKVNEYVDFVKGNGYFDMRRNQQAKYWMYETINEKLKTHFYQEQAIKSQLNGIEQRVLNGEVSSFQAAQTLLDQYYKKNKE